MHPVHFIMGDLLAEADYQGRLAEALRARRAEQAARGTRPGDPFVAALSGWIGAGLIRVGVRLQGASTSEAAAAGRGVITGAAR